RQGAARRARAGIWEPRACGRGGLPGYSPGVASGAATEARDPEVAECELKTKGRSSSLSERTSRISRAGSPYFLVSTLVTAGTERGLTPLLLLHRRPGCQPVLAAGTECAKLHPRPSGAWWRGGPMARSPEAADRVLRCPTIAPAHRRAPFGYRRT